MGHRANTASNNLSGSVVIGLSAAATVSNTLVIGAAVAPLTGTLFGSLAVTSTTLPALCTISGNSDQWNSNYTTTNTNSAAWSNWSTVSANYATGSQYVKLSGDTMTGALSTPALSTNNIFLAGRTLVTAPSAAFNVFIGDASTGKNTTTGTHNFVFGKCAGCSNTTGYNNNFLGQNAGARNTTGSNNNFFGILAGFSNTTGCYNNFLGFQAGRLNTTGCKNNFIGRQAGRSNTSGYDNNFLGNKTGYRNTTGSNNNFLGYNAGFCNTIGNHNNFFGFLAGNYNYTGNYNNFLGTCAGIRNTTGNDNNFFGQKTGVFNTSGKYNNFLGYQAGYANYTGAGNNFIGYAAGRLNTTGSCNNFLGYATGLNNSTGKRNNFLGYKAGFNNSTGFNNNFIGNCAGCANTIGSNNVIIGNTANVSTGSLSGVIVLGTNALATASNQLVIGSSTSPLSGVLFGSLSASGIVTLADFASVTNTYGSAVTPNKFFRLNSNGGLEIINSTYSASLLQITDDGAINVYGTGTAKVANNDALSGYIGFGNNNTQIYDDGNTHIHARGSGNGMWINTNNGQLNLLTQSPVNGGAVGTGVAIGSSTLNGYVSINSSRNAAIAQPYGYLNSSGASTTTGTTPNPYSLTCSSRIQSPEFNASSDERLKDNIVPITLEDATNFVKGVSAVTFNWKDAENPGKKSGFIAQQVMRAGFDHLISIVGNANVQEQIDADGFVSPASAALVMNYDQAIPYHGTVIKNLLERIEQLEAQIKKLK
ncbi:tail fiber domain-containing protein [bacterium]|nr:tail fiber domain-containing protein [bacterium]